MRGAQTAAAPAGQADSRPEVLYIRAFQEEEEMFAEILRRQKEFYTPSERTSFLLDPRFPTFEDYFYEDLNRTLGPLAALGNPTDFVPPNILAKRDYYEDADWQDKLSPAGGRCRLYLWRCRVFRRDFSWSSVTFSKPRCIAS